MAPSLQEAAVQGSTEPFLAACQAQGFAFEKYMEYMASLAEKCKPLGLRGFLGCA
jgi:pectin methylesterase-like acyl-CoA thioesterase